MATSKESGHAANVANLEKLNAFVAGYGVAYNPSKASIKLAALETLFTKSSATMKAMGLAESTLKNTSEARRVVMKPLDKLATRIGNAMKGTETPKAIIDGVKISIRKLHGTRVSPKASDEEKAAAAAAGKTIVETASHQKYIDTRLNHFSDLITLLGTIPTYTPNESELTVAGLTITLTDMKAKNKDVVDAVVVIGNARIARDEMSNKDDVGLVDISKDVKGYVKSIFHATSAQYKLISGIRFRKIFPK